MNNKVFIARINWIKPSDGGRKSPIPFNNEKYCPIVSVNGQKSFSGSEYGLLCNSFELIEDFKSLAYIRYLNTELAPENLYIGAKIELFEGAKLVAFGEIIKESNYKFFNKI